LNASRLLFAGLSALLLPVVVQAADTDRGRALFNNYCIACHGPDGNGSELARADLDPPPPVLLARGDATPEQYFRQVHDGSRQMPQMHDELTDEDIRNIVYALPEITGRDNPHWRLERLIDSQ